MTAIQTLSLGQVLAFLVLWTQMRRIERLEDLERKRRLRELGRP